MVGDPVALLHTIEGVASPRTDLSLLYPRQVRRPAPFNLSHRLLLQSNPPAVFPANGVVHESGSTAAVQHASGMDALPIAFRKESINRQRQSRSQRLECYLLQDAVHR
jgi:hypothetical protein